MAITLQKLTKKAGDLYKMRLVSGKSGMNNLVEWVHLIEDKEVSKFLNGNELIFTTGLWNHTPGDFMDFVDSLYDNGASGLVVNLGPSIKDISKSVIEYCDEKGFPLFVIPWEVPLVDVTREFCHNISYTEQNEASISGIFKDIIARCGVMEEQLPVLERRGFHRDSRYTVIIISGSNRLKDVAMDRNLKFYVEKIASRRVDTYATFVYDNYRVLVLLDNGAGQASALIEELQHIYLSSADEHYLVAIGPCETGLDRIPGNYRKVQNMLPLCESHRDRIVCYEQLERMKLLLEIHDTEVLRRFYRDVMGGLEDYDRENHGGNIVFLKKYLDNNGNIQRLADSMFVHRNTINYQIRKINTITGRDLSELKVKLDFMLCFYIRDLLGENVYL